MVTTVWVMTKLPQELLLQLLQRIDAAAAATITKGHACNYNKELILLPYKGS